MQVRRGIVPIPCGSVVDMADLVIRNGTIVDGTGAPPYRGDVAVTGSTITAVGDVDDRGTREVDAEGLLVTPGFVDIHTHFDGQVTWDPVVAPSSIHGVTTIAMGNCGVGFTPAVLTVTTGSSASSKESRTSPAPRSPRD